MSGLVARIWQVGALVRKLRPTLLHAHSSWAGVYARVLPVPVTIAYQPHGYKFEDPASPPVFRSLYRRAEALLARRADVVVVLSSRENTLASELSPRTPRLFVPNVPSIMPAENKYRSAAERVFMIGRLTRQKDPLFFMRVANLVWLTRPGTEFVWVGDGEEEYRSQLEANGVKITGWLDDQELSHFLDEPGIYLHSAAYEGFPLSLLDAVAFGHLAIARNIPALRGTPVAVEDSEEGLAQLLLDMLSGSHDAMIRAGVARSSLPELMSHARQADALIDLYSARP